MYTGNGVEDPGSPSPFSSKGGSSERVVDAKLLAAAASGDTATASRLLSKGADANAADVNGRTALMKVLSSMPNRLARTDHIHPTGMLWQAYGGYPSTPGQRED
jgi:hypothetical protein